MFRRWSLVCILAGALAGCGQGLEPLVEAEPVHIRAASDPIPGSAKDLYRIVNPGSWSSILQLERWSKDYAVWMAMGRWESKAHQYFSFVQKPNGNYTLVNYYSKKCLDVDGGSTASGARVFQWECHGGDNQEWTTVELDTGIFELRNGRSGRCLSIESGQLQQLDCKGSASQRWRIEQAQTNKWTVYANDGTGRKKCLDIDGGGLGDGAFAQQWDCVTGAEHQRFYTIQFEDSSWELKAVHSGKCLEITDSGVMNGARARQWGCQGLPHQRFLRTYTTDSFGGEAYLIKPKYIAKCLERNGIINAANGAPAQIWACASTSNQMWHWE